MNKAHKGFTLAELLIALALLGIIAAFTIPKVLNASSSQEKVAKIREAVSTIEQAWYGQKQKNALKVGTGNNLYENIIEVLNAANASNTITVDAAGAPLNGATVDNDGATAHPCRAAIGGLNVHQGWVVLQNGVVITGLESMPDFDMLEYNDSSHDATNNGVICIDYNGKAAPNRRGIDIFVGNFNQWGSFHNTFPGVNASGIPTSESLKNFNWGSTTTPVYDASNAATPAVLGGGTGIGAVAGDPGNGFPPALVGIVLAQ